MVDAFAAEMRFLVQVLPFVAGRCLLRPQGRQGGQSHRPKLALPLGRFRADTSDRPAYPVAAIVKPAFWFLKRALM